jgi:hypothetical protein
MKQILFFLLAMSLCALGSARADENVQAAQSRLKDQGFYLGDVTGVYDSTTAAAITRYQIRHGLAISGKLDAATAQALGVSAAKDEATEAQVSSGTWRRLRNGDMEFLKQLESSGIPPPGAQVELSPAAPVPKATAARQTQEARLGSNGVDSPERLRDYVAAFVLAGLDSEVGSELEFFADRVDYFGEHNVDREKIRRDLLRYDQRWPKRRFWLAGHLKVEPQANGELKLTFPLRYELHKRAKHSSGKVLKTLILRKTSDNNLQIVAVNEKRMD